MLTTLLTLAMIGQTTTEWDIRISQRTYAEGSYGQVLPAFTLPTMCSQETQRALLRKYAAQGYDIELKAQRTMDLNRTLQIRREYRLRLAAWQALHATAPVFPMYPVFDDTPPRSIFDLNANIRDLMNAGFMTPIN